MSGGVDSSATAALLKSEGYDVVGITLQLYDHGAATHRKGACCAGQDIHDARNVAERIGIPHYVLDYEERFKESVIDSFAASYASGAGQKPEIVAYSLNASSSSGNTTTSTTSSTSTSSSGGSSSGVSLKEGMHVFETAGCASCHTLAAAGSTGTVGPNLDQLKPSDALVTHQVINGGGGMPAFGSSLSKAQIQSVALFVSSVAGKPVKHPVKKLNSGGP